VGWLEALADLVRCSALTELYAATSSLERLAELVRAANARVAVLTRVRADDDELTEVMARAAGMPLIVLTADARTLAPGFLRSGARAMLAVDADEEQIVAAVMCAFHGLRVMPAAAESEADATAVQALATAPEPLTARELEILGLLAAGDSNKTIAARLSISVHTVKFHISSILAKLGVASRTEAVALGLRLGIVLL
jgi:two-component system, NarL family, response regulator YdfI